MFGYGENPYPFLIMEEYNYKWPESFGDQMFGGLDILNSLWSDITGLTSQEREFAHQDYLLEKEQSFSRDYKGQMAAIKEAGINPLTAAAGIAGSAGSAGPSAPSVSSNTSGVQGAINSLAGAAGVAGDVVEKLSSANERNTLLEDRRKQIVSDTFLKYKEAGYNDEMAKGLSIANAYMPTEKFLGLVSLSQQIDNARGEYQVMLQGIEESKARISEIDKHIEEMGTTISLNEKLALETEKRTLQIEAQTTELNWLNNKRKELGIDPRSPIENNLFMLGVKGDSGYNKALQISTDIAYSSASGSYEAQQTAIEGHVFAIESKKAAAEVLSSWLERPSSVAGAVIDIGKSLAGLISNGSKPDSESLAKIKHHNQFLQAYSEFKGELKKSSDIAFKKFCDARFNQSISQSEYEKLYEDYRAKKDAYNNLTEDDFSDLLMNQF